MTEHTQKKIRKILISTSEALLLIVTLFLVYVTITGIMFRNNPTKVPMPLGFNMFTVLTGSMQPYMEKGDKVIVVKTDTKDLSIGDVITFKHEGMIITHRIVELYSNEKPLRVQTKGDFNNTMDSFTVQHDQIVGKVLFRLTPINFFLRLINRT